MPEVWDLQIDARNSIGCVKIVFTSGTSKRKRRSGSKTNNIWVDGVTNIARTSTCEKCLIGASTLDESMYNCMDARQHKYNKGNHLCIG
jgi:hypothetical protein